MALPLPRLDDRTWEELASEARALIPAYAADWTDHNESDPGIALIELLAWLTEMVLYRADQVTDAGYETFLRLLNGPDWETSGDLEADLRTSVLALRRRYRAVTARDFERLVLDSWPHSEPAADLPARRGPAGEVRRVRCVARRNLDADPAAPAPGHVSLIVLAAREPGEPEPGRTLARPDPHDDLLSALWSWLDPRRLLTVRHHVVGPAWAPVTIAARVGLRYGAHREETLRAARAAIESHFDPLVGGRDGRGWPFGRDLYASDVYRLLEAVAGVDRVAELGFEAGSRPPADDGLGVALAAHELPEVTARIEATGR